MNCISLRNVNVEHNNDLELVDLTGCTSLEGLDFSHNHALKSLNLSKSKALKSLICFGTKITSMIPDWFSQINFEYDPRYEYQTIINQWGHEEKIYKDKGVGWWYPGEPERGYH